MKVVSILLGMAVALATPGHCQSGSTKEVNGFSSPESINSDGQFLYVANVGKELKPSEKDGDGYIAKAGLDGTLVKKDFITGLNAPKGMAIVGNTLYVADIDRVVGFSLRDGKQTYELSFSKAGTAFLNDLVAKDAQSLYVTATDVGKIFEVRLGDAPKYSELAIGTALAGPNGLAYDAKANQLYVVGFGKEDGTKGEIGLIDWKSGKPAYRKVNELTGLYDGVALTQDGQLLVSDWVAFEPAGVVRKIDLKTGKATVVGLRKVAGPADFHYDAAKATLYLPEMMAGNVLIQKEVR